MEDNRQEIFGNFMPYKLTDNTFVLSFMQGSQALYLLEGSEKALLIDTGWGAPVRALAERLTDKPVMVVNTHYHPDHAGANGEWEEVYVAKGYETDAPHIRSGPYAKDTYPHDDYKHIPVDEGFVFALGDRDVCVHIAKPAHCNSALFLTDEKEGMLFAGDDLDPAQVMLFNNQSALTPAEWDLKERVLNAKDNYLWMKEKMRSLRYLLPNHNGFPCAPSYLDDFITLCDHVLTGDAVFESETGHKYCKQGPNGEKLCRLRYKFASFIVFTDLYEELKSKSNGSL